MSELAICCDGIGKEYRLGARERYKTLREALSDSFSAPFHFLAPFSRNGHHRSGPTTESFFWALKNVSFGVTRGEILGIIGRNGAGKSTLLKILSRITGPTLGQAIVHGRIGSLLEVGTGFHPELTGRENIFLNGAILGMKKAEIARKFDEIVAFAEIEKFIDTPVKRYSSGMYVRLAFSVAAHVETEILLVDEVLAVGDAQFQKKCFEKFRQVRTAGRTILFVSHNMSALRAVCQNGLVLETGGVVDQGEINDVADRYLARVGLAAIRTGRVETKHFILEDVSIVSSDGPVIKTFDDVEIRVRFRVKKDINQPGLYVGFKTLDSQTIAGLDFCDFKILPIVRQDSTVELGFHIHEIPLMPGDYELELHLKDMGSHLIEEVPEVYRFEVVDTPVYGGRKLDNWFGYIALNADAVSRTVVEVGD